MKKLLVLVLLVLGSASMTFAGYQDFTLFNDSAYDWYEVYISPSSSYSWESELLGYDVLYGYESVDVSFSGSDADYWDIKIVDSYGDEGYVYGVDLSYAWAVHIYWDDYSYSYDYYTE